jgi:3alpha(or 20beta)-hydroxysteroid dehydrogenase
MSAQRFTDKTAVVTGAGGTIGRAVCQMLAAEGAAVVAVDLVGVEATQAAIEATGGVAQGVVADVTDPDSVEAYVTAARQLGDGQIHAFFNNAGIEGPVAPMAEYDVDAFDRVFAVNVRGVFLGMKHVAPFMPSGGSIVNTASTAALKGFAALGVYAGSKHAVLGLTRSMALELAPRGIRVNAVCPGPVEGRMMKSLEAGVDVEDGYSAFLATVPLGRYTTGEEIGKTVTFLLSSDAAYTTGAAYPVDGGQTVL